MQRTAVFQSSPPAKRGKIDHFHHAPASTLLEELLTSSVVLAEDWERLSKSDLDEISQCSEPETLLPLLVKHQLLTQYQADHVEAGKISGLIFGNYRVLERLGAGGMGIVFKAEHLDLRRPVALKLLCSSAANDPRVIQRFSTEMRAVAQLQHPNIVAAMDAGA